MSEIESVEVSIETVEERKSKNKSVRRSLQDRASGVAIQRYDWKKLRLSQRKKSKKRAVRGQGVRGQSGPTCMRLKCLKVMRITAWHPARHVILCFRLQL